MTKNVPAATAAQRRALSPRGKKVVAAALVLHLLLAGLTHRDISRRPADQIHGPKLLWRIVTGANTSFIVLYFAWGRRKAAR